jgi:hypothetical protein
MLAVALIVALALVLVLELVGVMRAKAGKADTISELWWALVARTTRPMRWTLNIVLVLSLIWVAVHLIGGP